MRINKKIALISSLAVISMTAGAVSAQRAKVRGAQKQMTAAPAIQKKYVVDKGKMNEEAELTEADFTVRGNASLAPVKTYDFNDGFQGWAVDAAVNVTWETKRVAAAGEAKSFSNIDENDVASLHVDGPYQTFKRETSSMTSPEIEVPYQGTLHFYVGCSLNNEDVSSLKLSASTDNFETSDVQLWFSREQQGEKPWAWREISVDISAFAGKKIKLRLTYGPGTKDSFETGGYIGDYYVDNISVSGMQPVDKISVMTGEQIELVSLSTGDIKSYHWTMPGASPNESLEQNPVIIYTEDGDYDITLAVTDSEGLTSTITRYGFVHVTGTEPVAKIVPPATFRLSSTGNYLVAPLVPVHYSHASTGFPTKVDWTFSGVSPEAYATITTDDDDPEVAYSYLHEQSAMLNVENSHGSSSDAVNVSVEYEGVVSNVKPEDTASYFDMDDWGVFPGSNTRKITAYAEKFSAPSVPSIIEGVYAYFLRADAEDLTDQISSVGVHLYTSKDGLPDKKIDSDWWNVNELNTTSTTGDLQATAFSFTSSPVVDDEFFIVVDGIPEYTETTCVALGMAAFRGADNTTFMLKDGKWVDVSTYFPAGKNHTSLMVYPSIIHSVMSPLPTDAGDVMVGAAAGTVTYEIFSYMGYNTPIESSADWLRVASEPNGYTVDDIVIEYDALPAGVTHREGDLTLTDGVTSMKIHVIQDATNAVRDITATATEGAVRYYNLQGVEVPAKNLKKGVYVKVTSAGATKIIR